MKIKSTSELSRRSVIRGAAVGLAALVLTDVGVLNAQRSWSVESPSTGPTPASTRPVSVDEYVREMPGSGDTTGAMTSLDGARSEYRKAVSIFPLLLPRGYAFPSDLGIEISEDSLARNYSVGTGGSQAFFFWQNAVAASAYAAYLRGDRATSLKVLDTAESGYSSRVREMYVVDPGMYYVANTLAPARNGNFTSLRAQGLDAFVRNEATRTIAEKAGDSFEIR